MRIALACLLLLGLAACDKVEAFIASPAAKSALTAAGALYCAVNTVTGPIIVTLINAEASSAIPGIAPIAVIATGAAKAQVDKWCAQAGGIAVSPPADVVDVPRVAVVVPVVEVGL